MTEKDANSIAISNVSCPLFNTLDISPLKLANETQVRTPIRRYLLQAS